MQEQEGSVAHAVNPYPTAPEGVVLAIGPALDDELIIHGSVPCKGCDTLIDTWPCPYCDGESGETQ